MTASPCVTLNVLPAIAINPRRGVGDELGSTVYLRTPLPRPLALDTLIHVTPLAAVQTQFGVANTVILPAPPAWPTDADSGEIV